MPIIPLRWNRSDKNAPPRPPSDSRRSHQVERATTPSQWQTSSLSLRAASSDVVRPSTVPDSAPASQARALSPRPSSSGARPSSSRLSRLRFRKHSSDTQLAARARMLDDDVPPVPAVPPTPAIITTAPTLESQSTLPTQTLNPKRSRLLVLARSRPSNASSTSQTPQADANVEADKRRFFGSIRSRDPASELRRLAGTRLEAQSRSMEMDQPPNLSTSELASPASVQSRSVQSLSLGGPPGPPGKDDWSSRDRSNRAFTWLPHRQWNRKSLFPLPGNGQPKPHTAPATAAATPRPSTSALSPDGSSTGPGFLRTGQSALSVLQAGNSPSVASISFGPRELGGRTSSVISDRSTKSSPAPALPTQHVRQRTSTVRSSSSQSHETSPTTPVMSGGSGRNSMSTAGRSSLSNLFGIGQKFRPSEAQSRQSSQVNVPSTSGVASASNSISMSREALTLPEREEGETAMQYLERVEQVAHLRQIPAVLSKRSDDFLYAVMRSVMRKFTFFGDPLDMAIRKLLLEVDLPIETQQIDRVLQGFAERYQECNPGIFHSMDNAYLISFSILMLHTDFFNKNNKHKMSKPDYLRNLEGEGIPDEVLECFYDNIIYTPFIRVEDDQDILTMRTRKTNRKTAKAAKAAKAAIRNVPSETSRNGHKEPLDPYTLIFESRLDTLRPALKDVMNLDDPYSYLGNRSQFDKKVLRNSKIGVIQIESLRSRPDAFMSPSGIENPLEAKVGLVDLPIDKVGVLWRKDPKKKTARSPWQEWGAILTGAGLLFYKNASWVKSYMHQYEHHIRHGGAGTLCFFKPPVSSYKPDYTLPTDHGVVLLDSTYRRHKNAFTFFRHNNSEEIFLADNEHELNDWLAKLNHQAACKTAGIRQRGLVGSQYDGQRQRGLRRLEAPPSSSTCQTVQTATGEVTIQSGKIDPTLAQEISAARRESMEQKIEEANGNIKEVNSQLDDLLHTARHMLILAPIQQKSREQLVHAAGRIQTKARWTRIELWRLTCHRDILQLDLEEEIKDSERRQARNDKLSAQTTNHSQTATSDAESLAEPAGSDRGSLLNNGTATNSTLSPAKPVQSKHAAKMSEDSVAFSSTTADEYEDYYTPPEARARSPTATKPPPQSPCSVATSASQPHSQHQAMHGHSLSVTSNYSHTSRLHPRAPRPSFDEALPSPTQSDDAVAGDNDEDPPSAQQRSDGDATPGRRLAPSESSRPTTPAVSLRGKDRPEDSSAVPSPAASSITSAAGTERNNKPRRLSMRALRDGGDVVRGNSRHGSRRTGSRETRESRESREQAAGDSAEQLGGAPAVQPPPTSQPAQQSARSSVAAMAVAAATDEPASPPDGAPAVLLRRNHGSFTVHGKKASVVTFGGEWTANAEETLQRMKSGHGPAAAAATATTAAATASATAFVNGAGAGARLSGLLQREASTSAGPSASASADGEDDEDTVLGLDADDASSTTPTPGSPGPEATTRALPPRGSSLRGGRERKASVRAEAAPSEGIEEEKREETGRA